VSEVYGCVFVSPFIKLSAQDPGHFPTKSSNNRVVPLNAHHKPRANAGSLSLIQELLEFAPIMIFVYTSTLFSCVPNFAAPKVSGGILRRTH